MEPIVIQPRMILMFAENTLFVAEFWENVIQHVLFAINLKLRAQLISVQAKNALGVPVSCKEWNITLEFVWRTTTPAGKRQQRGSKINWLKEPGIVSLNCPQSVIRVPCRT